MKTEFPLTLEEIVKWTGAQLVQKGTSLSFRNFTLDSRQVSPGTIFLARKGEKQDGHDYIKEVIQKGASVILFSDPKKTSPFFLNSDISFIEFQDPLRFLTELSKNYRRKFAIPIAAIVGANGKTTTKDIVTQILQSHGPALGTESSLNNEWGVPQTLLRLREEHRFAVLELGTNHFGEVASLAQIADPDLGLMTSVGFEHVEFLKDEEGSFRANFELFEYLEKKKNSGYVLNLDEPRLKKFATQVQNKITYSLHTKADFYLRDSTEIFRDGKIGWEFSYHAPDGIYEAFLPLSGEYNLRNAIAAIALSFAMGAKDPQKVKQGLQNFKPSKLRSELLTLSNRNYLYNDCYNANPSSFHALWENVPNLKRILKVDKVLAVVGDMKELGPQSHELHERVAREARKIANIDELWTTGEFAKAWEAGFGKDIRDFPNVVAMAESVAQHVAEHSKMLVLVKASRGAALEAVVERIKST